MLIELTDKVTLKTVNESTFLSASYNGIVTSPGSFCVNAQYLIDLLSKFNGDVVISTTEQGVLIKSGRSKYTTSSFSVADFLPLTRYDIGDNLNFHAIDLNSFREALLCVYSSASKDDPILSATYINKKDRKDYVICSNSELGAAVIKENLVNFPTGPIPKFIVDFILKLKDLRHMEFATQNDLFIGKAGGYTFAYRAPAIEYPSQDIMGFLESYTQIPESFKFNKADIMSALSRIVVIADSNTHAVLIKFNGKKLTIESDGPGNKGCEEIVLLDDAPKTYEISVDCIYLMNVLKELEGIIEWSCENADSPQFVSDGHLLKFFMGLA